MHQSFVKAAGPGNIGDCNFSLCKAGVYAQYCGEIFMVKALLKFWQVNVKSLGSFWAWKEKSQQFHGTAGTMLR